MKKFFLSALLLTGLLMLAGPARAQSWQWALRPTGTAGTAMQRALATDAQGNVYLAGTMDAGTATFGSSTLTAAGAGSSFVGKLTPAGQWLWAVEVPAVGSPAVFTAAAADAGGNLYLTGVLNGNTTFGSTVLSSGGAFVAKLNGQGQWQWATAATGGSGGSGVGLALDPATGDPVLVGATTGSWTYGATTLPNRGSTDGVVARLGAGTGQWLWAQAVATGSRDQLTGVAFDGAGAIYVTGHVEDPLTLSGLPPMPSTSLDVIVAKLSANGQTWLWANRFGGGGNDHGVAALPLATGEVAVAGDFQGGFDLGGTRLNSAGDRDLYVARLSGSTGAEVAGSAHRAGGPGRDDLISVVGDQGGNLLLCGMFNAPATFGTTTYPLVTAAMTTAYVARYLANGTWAWVATAGGPAPVTNLVLTADVTGTYLYQGGTATQSVQFGTMPALVAATGSAGTAYVGRLASVLGTRPAVLGGQAVQLWPNPASGQCAVLVPALPGVAQVAATLLDGLGRTARTLALPTGTPTALDLRGLPAGFYALRLRAGAETTTLRLAVE